MIQSFLDKFGAGKKQVAQAEPNTVIKLPEHGEILANKDQSKYQSGVGKMVHMKDGQSQTHTMQFTAVHGI